MKMGAGMTNLDGERTALEELFLLSYGPKGREAMKKLLELGYDPQLIAFALEDLLKNPTAQNSLINQNKHTPNKNI
jgi:hypothetical protein